MCPEKRQASIRYHVEHFIKFKPCVISEYDAEVSVKEFGRLWLFFYFYHANYLPFLYTSNYMAWDAVTD